MPLQGKATGDRLELSLKHPDFGCDVSATGQEPGPIDGLYRNARIECDPPRANLRWQDMTICGISMRVTRNSGSGSCALEVTSDGTFAMTLLRFKPRGG